MRNHVSRLVGFEGFEVKLVIEVGGRLDLEVELAARAGCCPRCGRLSLEIKGRPGVRMRDLPLAARVTQLVWRKRRYRCAGCGRSFSESHPELPARRRVTRRFRRRLLERVRGGAAHAGVAREERTTRYQVCRAFRAGPVTSSPHVATVARRGGCRSTRPTTAAAASSRRWSPTSTASVSWRCSTGAVVGGWGVTCARCRSGIATRSRSSRSTPWPTARRSTTS
jgi:zinc-finger of transposase IS204/IS1001/IS1096/IS1165